MRRNPRARRNKRRLNRIETLENRILLTADGFELFDPSLDVSEPAAVVESADYTARIINSKPASGAMPDEIWNDGDFWNDEDPNEADWGWTNHKDPLDVNLDGFTSPLDALMVINFLNDNLSITPSAQPGDEGFVDVNGDAAVSPLDVLLVINHLNDRSVGGDGLSPTDVSQRIVNGDPTSDFDAVGIVNGGCTGTIISPIPSAWLSKVQLR